MEVLRFPSHYFQLKNGTPVFQKTSFKVKVMKTFKISSDYHIKICPSFKQRAISKVSGTIFLEEPMLSLLTLKK